VLLDETGIDAVRLQDASRLLEDDLEDRGLFFRGVHGRNCSFRGFTAERIAI